MRIDDLLIISLRQVFRHRRRYWGVALAIALGVAGFTAIVTMGRDVKAKFNQDLELIGGVTIIKSYYDQKNVERPQWFHSSIAADLRRTAGVQEVSLVGTLPVQGNWRQEHYSFQILAVDEAFWEVRNLWAFSGSLFNLPAVIQRQKVCVLGTRLAQKIFGRGEASGKILEINSDLYRVVGVVGGLTDIDLAHCAFLPLTTSEDRLPGELRPKRLYVRCFTWDDVEKVAAAIPKVIGAHQSTENLQVEVAWEGLKHVKKVAWWIEFFIYLAVVATFTLGGMGIWNVMMAAVRSRTREIGLKKAMGAQDWDILAQFLTEALCLSLGSALVGIILGRVLVEITSTWTGSRPPEDLFISCFFIGLVFAVILGVISGLYPSLQASRMEVVTATRYE
ncbi:MAG: ABC transporter permease [Thermodesulfobacteriota bacterium]